MMRRFFLTIPFLLAVATGFAQEPIPVRLEPRHHNVFENPWVRVLDVRIPPGDTSLMHKHETPSVFIVLGNTKTGSQVLVEPARVQFSQESIWYESFASSPRIHRVWNSDTSIFHTIDLELPNKNPVEIEPPLHRKDMSVLFDEKFVRGYRLKVEQRAGLYIPKRKAPIVVIGLDQAGGMVTVNDKIFVQKGDWLFVPAGAALKFSNKSGERQSFAVFELK
ncbi:MAG: hypothetical protein Q8943_11405 [Bacteroidota bacterium]|nr:hypothetical protein [Bacteroidota bacterium]